MNMSVVRLHFRRAVERRFQLHSNNTVRIGLAGLAGPLLGLAPS